MRSSVLLNRLQRGDVQNVKFRDLRQLLEALGFRLERIRGSHHIFAHPNFPKTQLNLQPTNGEVKPYQVRQFLQLIEENKLNLEEP